MATAAARMRKYRARVTLRRVALKALDAGFDVAELLDIVRNVPALQDARRFLGVTPIGVTDQPRSPSALDRERERRAL